MHSSRLKQLPVITAAILLVWSQAAICGELTIRVRNTTALTRADQTIEVSSKVLSQLEQGDLATIHVTDALGNEVLCQAVDDDFDPFHKPDILIFQADFGPNEAKLFKLATGDKQAYSREQFRAFGRFVRERFDDFAWENDRIAHRTYGRALATWEGEPLSSSTVDIWSKRTPRMVINDWYMADNYHADHGEGADLYSAGLTRGCGGNGLWAADRLWVSRAFVESRTLANGPIRVMFELVYEPFEVNGVSVSEVKRVTLDAGHQLNRFESRYKPYVRPGRETGLVSGIGLKKVKGESLELNAKQGWMAKWEAVAKNGGQQGLAVIVDPEVLVQSQEDDLNHLMLVNVGSGGAASYWAGFCWDKAGHITDFEAWKQYVANYAQMLSSPIEITVEPKQ